MQQIVKACQQGPAGRVDFFEVVAKFFLAALAGVGEHHAGQLDKRVDGSEQRLVRACEPGAPGAWSLQLRCGRGHLSGRERVVGHGLTFRWGERFEATVCSNGTRLVYAPRHDKSPVAPISPIDAPRKSLVQI